MTQAFDHPQVARRARNTLLVLDPGRAIRVAHRHQTTLGSRAGIMRHGGSTCPETLLALAGSSAVALVRSGTLCPCSFEALRRRIVQV
jgi:hypothetical protein